MIHPSRILAVALAVSTLSPTVTAAQTDSLLVNYQFNGDAADSSGNANHGTISGAVLTEDRFGNPDAAYLFDGTDDFIGMPALWTDGSDQLTVAAWFSAEDTTSEGKIVYHGDSGEFQILYEGMTVAAGVHTASAWHFVSTTINPNAWYSAALTWERGEYARLFVNGVVADSLAVPDEGLLDVGSAFPASVGSYGQTRGINFKGSIDDIRIYARALGKNEINALYFWSSVGTESPVPETPVAVLRNHPNPFSSSTILDLVIARPTQVRVSIYNILGQHVVTVADNRMPAGMHSLMVDTTEFPNGMYVCVIEAEGAVRSKRLTKLN